MIHLLRSTRVLRASRARALIASLASLASLAALAGCGDGAPTGGGASNASNASSSRLSAGGKAALPANVALSSEPAGAKGVGETIEALAAAGPVVMRGRVGVEGSDSAYFSLVDLAQKGCIEMGDECPTPWDYCCTPAEVMAKQSATVEFRVDGKLATGSVLGVHGIDHLKEVVVTGEASKDSAGNVVVVASGIWVKP